MAQLELLQLDRGTGHEDHQHAALAGRHADFKVDPHHRIRLQAASPLLELVSGLGTGFAQGFLQGLGTPAEKSRMPANMSRTTLMPCTDSALTMSRYAAICRPSMEWVVVVIMTTSLMD